MEDYALFTGQSLSVRSNIIAIKDMLVAASWPLAPISGCNYASSICNASLFVSVPIEVRKVNYVAAHNERFEL